MSVFSNPFFWVALSLLGMLAGNSIVGRTAIGSRKVVGAAIIALVLLPRFLIPLEFVDQARFVFQYQTAVGAILMIAAFCLWAPLYQIVWSTGPAQSETLRTSGVFRLVRHPGYLGDVLAVLGWSVIFGSVAGVALTPLWLLAFYMHCLIEENSMLEEYGERYCEYQRKVKSRILPCIPF